MSPDNGGVMWGKANVGASIITNTIFGVFPYCNYSILGPKFLF